MRKLPLLLALVLALGFLPTAVGAQGFPPNDKIAPVLLAQMAADPTKLQPVIVEMQAPTWPFSGQPGAQRAQQALALITQNGLSAGALPIVNGAAGWLNAAGIQAVAALPTVAYIHDDATVQPRPNISPPPAWPQGQLGSLYGRETHADRVWPQATGSGVAVAVLDSGVAADPDLGNRVIASVGFAGNRTTPDGGGHGTHVAGIIAGNGTRSNGEFKGMAPTANVVDVQVLDSRGNGRLSSVVAGIGWVLTHRTQYNIRVINLSFGAPTAQSYRVDPLSAAIEIAWRRGIVVVAAAGNRGPASGTVDTPGINPYAITVGAIDDQDTLATSNDVLAWFSSWGTPIDGQPKPDLSAPGRRIVSVRVPGSTLDTLMPDHVVSAANGASYFRLTGTSQATGVVSGAVALMLQSRPTLTPAQVKAILVGRTQSYGGVGSLPDPSADGSGLLDASAAFGSGLLGNANQGLRHSNGAARVLYPLVYGQPLVWRDPSYQGIAWNLLGWLTLSWDNIAWDNIAWDSFNYSNIAWDNIAWDNIAWDNIAWDKAGWDNIAWDNITWD